MNWSVVAALAASLTALAAVTIAVMVFWQVRQDTQHVLFNTGLDSLWRFEAQWNSAGMAGARGAAAAALLDGRPTRDVDAVLDFFDQIARLASRSALDEEMLWYDFYWPMANYWFASEGYRRQMHDDDPRRWEQLGALLPRLAAIEARRKRHTADEAGPTKAQIHDFLTAESDSGECVEDQEAETRKVPL